MTILPSAGGVLYCHLDHHLNFTQICLFHHEVLDLDLVDTVRTAVAVYSHKKTLLV